MTKTGWCYWTVASLAGVVALCGVVGVAVGGAEATTEVTLQQFRAMLDQAAAALEQGDAATAQQKLRDAARLTTDDVFHTMLADAADDYDAGKPKVARLALKRATSYLNPWFWVILGFIAQAMFVGRFAVQWIASERRGESVVPIAFWYFSLLGSWGLLAYALWRQDIVIILGQALNSVIYIRNLTLIYRKQKRDAAAAGQSGEETAR